MCVEVFEARGGAKRGFWVGRVVKLKFDSSLSSLLSLSREKQQQKKNGAEKLPLRKKRKI